MNDHDHIGDIVQVGAANMTAIIISLTDFETVVRITSLILACAYTIVKLYQAIKNERNDH